MNINELLSGYPASRPVDPAVIADRVRRSRAVLVVLDDDPTGTQSVADLPVLTSWDVADFEWALATGAPAVYVLTNSRSVDAGEATRINREVVTAAVTAARARGVSARFASRSDSTLRGHFPLEPDVIAATLVELGEQEPTGVVVVPAFPDAGRVTVGGVHGMVAGDDFTPVGETEFAQDSTFGYRSSRLVDWVAEKSDGRIPAAAVVELTLDVIRSGAEAIGDALAAAAPGSVIVADAVDEDDLRHLALGLELAEAGGRSYIYRVGPPFVRARIGQAPRRPLDTAALGTAPGATAGGVIIVGSHVGLTSRQLADLKRERPDTVTVEIDVPALLEPSTGASIVDDAVERVIAALVDGDVVVHSSRTLIRTDDPDESLAISRRVSDALVAVVSRTLAARPPRFVIAKGGITSSDVASRGLSIRRAIVRGSLFPGIVSVWEPADGPATGIPYVVFAGNVGSDTSLSEAVAKLSLHRSDAPESATAR